MDVSADKIIASLHNLHDTQAAAFTALLNLVYKQSAYSFALYMYVQLDLRLQVSGYLDAVYQPLQHCSAQRRR